MILRESGINLSETKRALLVGRLGRRLRELGLDSFEEYLGRVEASADERVLMLDAIATNETRFFREPGQFEFLKERVLPAWLEEGSRRRRPHRVRIWSAGCSTGEEPFSLAMLLASYLPKTWDLEILATDLSTKALARARAGVWPLERSREIPPDLLKAYMLRGTGPEDGKMKAGPELRALVRFERINLAGDNWPPDGPFDAILCRNVLIYFDADGKRRAVSRLLDRLAPGGFFFVGHAETLNGITDRVRPLMPSAYTNGEALPRGSRSGAGR
ncbi:MAG TPA: protein-glutamate O-methyltransferase CheR [Thermoanaerobaculia bacterium]|nr:protein-glutamate O-methyltransferase CheR [Thermoanaerobaculia bacterium]